MAQCRCDPEVVLAHFAADFKHNNRKDKCGFFGS